MTSESTSERVRPCLKCGALLGFPTGRCPECGASLPEVEDAEKRVECCMACGVMVPFGTAECPECGGAVRIPFDGGDEQVKPCIHCGELVTFADVYCVRCGDLTVALDLPEIPPAREPVRGEEGMERAADWIGVGVLALAGLSLATAAVLLAAGA